MRILRSHMASGDEAKISQTPKHAHGQHAAGDTLLVATRLRKPVTTIILRPSGTCVKRVSEPGRSSAARHPQLLSDRNPPATRALAPQGRRALTTRASATNKDSGPPPAGIRSARQANVEDFRLWRAIIKRRNALEILAMARQSRSFPGKLILWSQP